MKHPLKLGILVLAGVGLGAGLAELLSMAFLPAPVPQKRPFVRLTADEYSGYRHRPSQVGYGLSGRITINRWGFRGRDWELDKPHGVVRIALLGDSVVFGQGVHDEETYGAQLEELLNDRAEPGRRYEVMNFGASGYDTGHELRVLEHHALRFHPDLVLLHFFLNDLLYVNEYSFYPELFARSEREFVSWRWRLRQLVRRSRLVMTLWDLWQDRGDNPMNRIVDAYLYQGLIPPSGPGAEGWRFVLSRLQDFRDLSLARGFIAALVILPLPQEVLNPQIRATYPAFLVERSRAIGVATVEVLPDLRTSGRGRWELFIPYDYHFAREGNRVVAQLVAREILALAAAASP